MRATMGVAMGASMHEEFGGVGGDGDDIGVKEESRRVRLCRVSTTFAPNWRGC